MPKSLLKINRVKSPKKSSSKKKLKSEQKLKPKKKLKKPFKLNIKKKPKLKPEQKPELKKCVSKLKTKSSRKITKTQSQKIVLNSQKNTFDEDDFMSVFMKVKKIEIIPKEKIVKKEVLCSLDDSKCGECDSINIFFDNGRLCCHDCGLLQGMQIQQNAEWRYYGSDDSKTSDPTRCGMPTSRLLPESSLGSIISTKFTGKFSADYYKMRKYHQWNAMPYKERSLYSVFKNIHSKAHKAGIPGCIIEEAKSMYKVLNETQISRGSNRRGLIASCIYIACKKKKVPRTANEIAAIFEIKPSEMTNGCKLFLSIMHKNKKASKIEIKASTSLDFINRFCSNLNLDANIINICFEVAKKAEKYSIVDENTPPSVAAGSIYLVCNLLSNTITKKQVAKACKISEVTISKCYKKLHQYQSVLFPSEVLNKLKHRKRR